VAGTIRGDEVPVAGARLVLSVHYPDNPILGDKKESVLGPGGTFAFEPIFLAVAGKEYSKRYKLYLSLREGASYRVLWRARYSRLELGPPVQLDCDLARRPSQGQVCWTINGLEQTWLVRAGRRDFEKLCASCHGLEGLGDGSASVAKGDVPSDLTKISGRRGGVFPRAEIAERIDGRRAPPVHGTRTMPVWGERLERDYAQFEKADELAGARIDAIVTFLEALQQANP
jgi:mono/diheme cytochrome c family protein